MVVGGGARRRWNGGHGPKGRCRAAEEGGKGEEVEEANQASAGDASTLHVLSMCFASISSRTQATFTPLCWPPSLHQNQTHTDSPPLCLSCHVSAAPPPHYPFPPPLLFSGADPP